ncbi:hypothetical protein [Halioxenophilus sp. WMMB6]|uniref:hypothetical protein n=1 Tax=Halioxenophilus sp. WMMB6 TaxID=3073815 RepID=UPI00295E7364|nr:hypothetical protein [Halioxenophilus sp. WMMB6]
MSVWALALTPARAEELLMYRYLNDQGVKVINHTIPPEYAQKGYEVVNIHGDVLRVVEPSIDPEQLAELERQREQQAAMEQWDKALLSRYSSVGDVEAAKKRRLQEIDAALAMLKGNIVGLDSQIAREQAKAAERERNGQNVPEAILLNIKNFKTEKEANERLIETRESEYIDVSASFDRDIERFKVIQDRIGRRR